MTLTLLARSAMLMVVPFVSAAPVATRFYALNPCRIVDTRNANGLLGGLALAASARRNFTLTGQCSVPVGATSVSANVTVVTPSIAGVFRLFPADQSVPNTSTVSFGAGLTRANNALLLLDASGSVAVQNDAGTAHIVIDVNGYFR